MGLFLFIFRKKNLERESRARAYVQATVWVVLAQIEIGTRAHNVTCDDANSDDGPRYFDHHNLDFLTVLTFNQILNNNKVGFLCLLYKKKNLKDISDSLCSKTPFIMN